ncbi:MAG: tRNA (adenosine(37)-N6)-dimethylallyltransferase MiaA [Anaerolineaceae bacterium 4572_78]|nr:MAG: tRNA (adenosine(37)-N6)-dimethylallyltransferase MiaA [Anaerolineaceae bacterium 4572_78]
MSPEAPLISIVGPTGIGKTKLAIHIAQKFQGQIISADSRQIYKMMDIGTAKPTVDELAAAHHHVIDILFPNHTLTLAEFQERAYQIINNIHAQEKLPLLVGGTGQWVKSVIEGWGIPHVPPDNTLRDKLYHEADTFGAKKLHDKLFQVDPQAANKIDYRNIRRVVRALEVYYKTGIPISVHQKKTPPPYHIVQIGLTMPREQLYERIDKRIDAMMAQGLLAEVQNLVEQGYGLDLPSMSGLGYKQLGLYLTGELTLDESVALIKRETRRFIRQQYNWFRLTDENIDWFDVSLSNFEEAAVMKVATLTCNF